MKIAYFDCFAGISGDMILGALVDCGASFEDLKNELNKLALNEYDITIENTDKRGISASDVYVKLHHHHHSEVHDHHEGHHSHGRSFTEIKRIIEESSLSNNVKSKSIAIFRRLGEAEAKIHNKSLDDIHFHEVGAVDAIVDIVGACICLELLQIERVYSSPMPTFSGTVEMAHGKFPLPAPATAEILKDVPWRKLGIEGEIVTPTGAAIIRELAQEFGEMPEMRISAIGYGAGKKDFGIPNVLRVMIGETSSELKIAESSVSVIEANIDDLNPQFYEAVMEKLFAAGALDVYLTPVQMKKNRPAVLISVLCNPEDVSRMADILFAETTTIGIRIDTRSRICLPREIVNVETQYGTVRMKVARRNGEVVNANPEYEDCKSAAAKHNVPISKVRDAAISKYWIE